MITFLLIFLGIWMGTVTAGLTLYGGDKLLQHNKHPYMWLFWPFVVVGASVYGLWALGKQIWKIVPASDRGPT